MFPECPYISPGMLGIFPMFPPDQGHFTPVTKLPGTKEKWGQIPQGLQAVPAPSRINKAPYQLHDDPEKMHHLLAACLFPCQKVLHKDHSQRLSICFEVSDLYV